MLRLNSRGKNRHPNCALLSRNSPFLTKKLVEYPYPSTRSDPSRSPKSTPGTTNPRIKAAIALRRRLRFFFGNGMPFFGEGLASFCEGPAFLGEGLAGFGFFEREAILIRCPVARWVAPATMDLRPTTVTGRRQPPSYPPTIPTATALGPSRSPQEASSDSPSEPPRTPPLMSP